MPGQLVFPNINEYKDKLLRFSLPKAQNISLQKAKVIVAARKKEFLEEFNNHEITQEIESGANAGGSLDVEGNLFSFIGFDAGSDPIGDLRYYFENLIKITRNRGIYNSAAKTLEFRYSLPSPEGIKKVTDLGQYTTQKNKTQYGAGKSWLYGIETGTLINLDRYLYRPGGDKDSRSPTGLEIMKGKPLHEGASFGAKKYVTEMINSVLQPI